MSGKYWKGLSFKGKIFHLFCANVIFPIVVWLVIGAVLLIWNFFFDFLLFKIKGDEFIQSLKYDWIFLKEFFPYFYVFFCFFFSWLIMKSDYVDFFNGIHPSKEESNYSKNP